MMMKPGRKKGAVVLAALLTVTLLLFACGEPAAEGEAPSPLETAAAEEEAAVAVEEEPVPQAADVAPLFGGELDQSITMPGGGNTPETVFYYPASLTVLTCKDGKLQLEPASAEEKDAHFFFAITRAAQLGTFSDVGELQNTLASNNHNLLNGFIQPAPSNFQDEMYDDAFASVLTLCTVSKEYFPDGGEEQYIGVMVSRIVDGPGGPYLLVGWNVVSTARAEEATTLLEDILANTTVLSEPKAVKPQDGRGQTGSDPGDTYDDEYYDDEYEDWSDPGDTEDWSDPGDMSDPGDTY